MSEPKSYSIILRLRRITIEEAFVSVPVTEELLRQELDERGYRHLDVDKMTKMALSLGRQPETRSMLESEPIVEPHPIQTAPPTMQ